MFIILTIRHEVQHYYQSQVCQGKPIPSDVFCLSPTELSFSARLEGAEENDFGIPQDKLRVIYNSCNSSEDMYMQGIHFAYPSEYDAEAATRELYEAFRRVSRGALDICYVELNHKIIFL